MRNLSCNLRLGEKGTVKKRQKIARETIHTHHEQNFHPQIQHQSILVAHHLHREDHLLKAKVNDQTLSH